MGYPDAYGTNSVAGVYEFLSVELEDKRNSSYDNTAIMEEFPTIKVIVKAAPKE